MTARADDPMLEKKLDDLTRRFEDKVRDDAEKHRQNRADIHRLGNSMDTIALQQKDVQMKLENVLDLKHTVQRGFNDVDKKLDTISSQTETNTLLTKLVIGDGQPGQGRLGVAERSIEFLKRFVWQFAGGIAVILFVLDLLFRR